MKYRLIYEVMDRRRRADRRFLYDDYSFGRRPEQRHGQPLGPLWIVARDPTGGRRFWIVEKNGVLELSVVRRDEMGLDHKMVLKRRCKTQREMAALLAALFERGGPAL
ncbi:hypothetical protein [Pseudoflavonifractor sp. An184]|uniref:hypothetical protein n=1 Tax=Pseudoflavonifractor sp. An184 TaxID=1965576 RepID=UPI000B398644|nr:hypothetical protein [Pseudoflavonifractor sp. An184]OUP56899.1 hypothetical protein B5F19_05155 [Pseudoflavonifractor sp. An184]